MPSFPQAAEMLGRQPRSTLLLQDSCTTSARVCMSGVAFKSHDRTVEGDRRRSLMIIFAHGDYEMSLMLAGLDTLEARRAA